MVIIVETHTHTHTHTHTQGQKLQISLGTSHCRQCLIALRGERDARKKTGADLPPLFSSSRVVRRSLFLLLLFLPPLLSVPPELPIISRPATPSFSPTAELKRKSWRRRELQRERERDREREREEALY